MSDNIEQRKKPKDVKSKVKEKEIFDLSKYKKTMNLDNNIKDKELEWIKLSPAFEEATGIPGFAKGFVNLIRGYTNTGKSTGVFEAAVSCQKMGILPVIIDTESSFTWEHLKTMGFEFTEIADEETGEIVSYEGNFIYINGDHLVSLYGKTRDKNRVEPVVEDVAALMYDLLDQQKKGTLPVELCFIWDSIGTLNCEKGIMSKSSNNMWTAGAMEQSFKSLMNFIIPSSRKEGKEYTNTFIGVQKVWLDNENKTIKHKGGEFMYYVARLVFHCGGILSHGTEKLTAERNGETFSFGIRAKIKVEKNQVTPVSLQGRIVSTPHGYIGAEADDIAKYKKDKKSYIDKYLSGEGDIKISAEEVKDMDYE